MGLANGPPDPLRIRHSQNVNRCQLARRLGQLAAWGMNTTTTSTSSTNRFTVFSLISRRGSHSRSRRHSRCNSSSSSSSDRLRRKSVVTAIVKVRLVALSVVVFVVVSQNLQTS